MLLLLYGTRVCAVEFVEHEEHLVVPTFDKPISDPASESRVLRVPVSKPGPHDGGQLVDAYVGQVLAPESFDDLPRDLKDAPPVILCKAGQPWPPQGAYATQAVA